MRAQHTTIHQAEPPLPLPCSPRAIAVARHFGVLAATVPATRRRTSAVRGAAAPMPAPRTSSAKGTPPIALPALGEILFVGGASGSGKSSLVRRLLRDARRSRPVQLIDLRRIPLPERPVVDLFAGTGATSPNAFAPTLRRLSRVGLAEVWTWLRPPSQLSEGQRWRLRLALAMRAVVRSDASSLIVCDEFAALLDRVTAAIVAGVLRRFVDERPDRVSAIVATSHDDVAAALNPDVLATCDFGQVTLRRRRRRRDGPSRRERRPQPA